MSALLPDGTKQISLSSEQYGKINDVLSGFYERTKCGAVLLADGSGLLIAQCGQYDPQEMSLLSALTAANYSATREMAKMIGESNAFKVHFHEGEENNIYTTGVDDDFSLSVIFGKSITFGMVRVMAAKATEKLSSVVAEIASVDVVMDEEEVVREQLRGEEFQDELIGKLDALLGGNGK